MKAKREKIRKTARKCSAASVIKRIYLYSYK